MNKKTILKNIMKYIAIIFLVTGIQIGLLVLVACIPRSSIQKNTNKSADYLAKQQVFFYLHPEDAASCIDRYADSILLNIAYNYDSSHPLTSIMRSSYYNNKMENENKNLKTAVTKQPDPTIDYTRYWHGSNIVVRPLLTILELKHIYILNAVILVVLLALLLIFIRKHLNTGVAVCFIIAMVMTSFWYVPFSLEYTWIILCMLAASIYTFHIKEKGIFSLTVFFLVLGSFTAYFDFLTTETLTLMIPLILLLCYRHKQEQLPDMATGLRFSASMGVFWLIGYASAWIMKWTCASIILHENVFRSSMEQAEYRINGTTENVTGLAVGFSAIIRNIACLFPFSYIKKNGALLFMLLFIIVLCIYYIFKKTKDCHLSTLLLLLGLIPYLRFVILSNHSYIHFFFTYRAQLSSILCIGLALMYGIDQKHIINVAKNIKKRT